MTITNALQTLDGKVMGDALTQLEAQTPGIGGDATKGYVGYTVNAPKVGEITKVVAYSDGAVISAGADVKDNAGAADAKGYVMYYQAIATTDETGWTPYDFADKTAKLVWYYADGSIEATTWTVAKLQTLATAKTDAKAAADALLTGLTQADYTVASWTALTDAIAADKTAIDEKATVAEVTSYTLTGTAAKAALVTATPVISGTPTAGDTTITGTCVDSAAVMVTINSGTAAAATVTGTSWTITVAALAKDDTISVVATKAPDTASAAATKTVAAAPVATATPVISGTPTAGDTTITGTCVDGATVMVTINSGTAAAATVTGTGWTITVAALAESDTISVVATKAPDTASAAATAIVAAAPVVPTDKVTALAFTDTDTDAGTMGGTLTWTAPADVSNVTNYVVYASADGTIKGAQIGTDVAVGTNQLVIPAGTTLAPYIIVVTKNAVGEAIAANYANVAVTDVVPVITLTKAGADTFTVASNYQALVDADDDASPVALLDGTTGAPVAAVSIFNAGKYKASVVLTGGTANAADQMTLSGITDSSAVGTVTIAMTDNTGVRTGFTITIVDNTNDAVVQTITGTLSGIKVTLN